MRAAQSSDTWILAGAVVVATLGVAVAFNATAAQSGAAHATASNTGTLKGRVPVLARKAQPALKDYGAKPSIKIEPPDPPASAVWVGSGAPCLDAKAAPVARIEQRGFQFRPAVMVVQTGTPVVFPNEDQMYHSVFSYSEAKRFDLGRFRKGEEPEAVVFDKPGVVELYCEVHEHMRAWLIAVDTPWFARTPPDGSFEISGITPGKYTVTVWVSRSKQFEKSIEIAAGQTLDVDWSDIAGTSTP